MTKKHDEGILPTIEDLRNSFKDFMAKAEPLLDTSTNLQSEQIQRELSGIYDRFKILPDQLAKSYELIQLVIHSIHSSRTELKKSVDGLLRKTGQQLQIITSTTEEATNKIMDMAEKLDEEQLNIIDMVDQISGADEQATKDLIDKIKDKLRGNQDAAFAIIDYLQFQDITAQQISGAYSLLADTERTLIFVSNMLRRFDIDSDILADAQRMIDKNSFNADARFSDKADIQNAIDDLFGGNEGVDIPVDTTPEPAKPAPQASQASTQASTVNNDDIDAMFNDAPAGGGQTVDNDDIDALFNDAPASSGQTVNNDDIDALFNDAPKESPAKKEDVKPAPPAKKPEAKKEEASNEAVSQDDIDALFN